MKTKEIYDFWGINLVNTLFGISGLIIIWISTNNGWAMIGGVIAGLHFQFSVKR